MTAAAETLPVNILEKISQTLRRNILPDEKLERERYKLRTERQKLYLQLSSEYKKRDALFLADYSEWSLKQKIKEQNKVIKEIQEKIDKNLAELKKLEIEAEKDMATISIATIDEDEKEKNEFELLSGFFKRVFENGKSVITEENISFYQNDFTKLYVPSDAANESGYLSGTFEKEIYEQGINCLLTGNISNYGDYCSISVNVYLYPGAKLIGSVMEVGSLSDIDLMTTSLANQIIPNLTNSMPVLVYLSLSPETKAEKFQFYIDDILQPQLDVVIIESGVHTIQFASEGYKTAATTFYFDGNSNYQIEINFKEKNDGKLYIGLRKPIFGSILVNGEQSEWINFDTTEIKINGSRILGEFISGDGETAFFYVPEKYIKDESFVTIKPKPYNREENIDKRRRWMYGSYSALIVSLIPTFYTYGQLMNEVKLYNDRRVSYNEAVKYQNAYNVCSAISIGCGVFFAFELVRYFIAANSVLPEKAMPASVAMPPIDLRAKIDNDNKDDFNKKSDINTDNEINSGE